MLNLHRAAPGQGPARTAVSTTPTARTRGFRPTRTRLLTLGATLAVVFTLCLLSGPAIAQTPSRVTVQPGDTLSGIALRLYGDESAAARIAAANRLVNPDRILAGTELQLPAAGGAAAASSATARRVTVAPGETLSAIALRVYGSEEYTAALATANGIADPDRIRVGQELSLPAAPPSPAAPPTARNAYSSGGAGGGLAGRRICVDPGHGGVDPGTAYVFENGRTLREADVTLDISLALAQRLRAQGAAVILTRQTDLTLELADRAYRCNAAGAELMVSVHLNGVDNPAINGALALYGTPAERPLAEVMAGVMQSGLFAGRGVDATSFGARQFPGRVLLYTSMPAVLVEPAFLTNPLEARALVAPTADPSSRRAQIVREIERGIVAYLR